MGLQQPATPLSLSLDQETCSALAGCSLRGILSIHACARNGNGNTTRSTSICISSWCSFKTSCRAVTRALSCAKGRTLDGPRMPQARPFRIRTPGALPPRASRRSPSGRRMLSTSTRWPPDRSRSVQEMKNKHSLGRRISAQVALKSLKEGSCSTDNRNQMCLPRRLRSDLGQKRCNTMQMIYLFPEHRSRDITRTNSTEALFLLGVGTRCTRRPPRNPKAQGSGIRQRKTSCSWSVQQLGPRQIPEVSMVAELAKWGYSWQGRRFHT